MNIYEYATQMELDGERYYRELARKSKSPGLSNIFSMLAGEEVKHYRIIENLRRRESGPPEMAETKILEDVKNVFAHMSDNEPSLRIDTTEETQSYRKACEIEEESRKFYREKADEVEAVHQRQIFLQLAAEEAKHLRIMENIVEFVSRPEPGNWLENAEWHHLDEY